MSVMKEEMSWEIYYDVVLNKSKFEIKVEIRNGVVDVLHNCEEGLMLNYELHLRDFLRATLLCSFFDVSQTQKNIRKEIFMNETITQGGKSE